MVIKGIVLNVVRCVCIEDVLEYARIFSVIVGIEKDNLNLLLLLTKTFSIFNIYTNCFNFIPLIILCNPALCLHLLIFQL